MRSKRGISRTSTAIRPVSGIRFVTPSVGSRVPSGSISITISRPGFTTSPGISAFADFKNLLSFNSVGIDVDFPGISSTCASTPFRYNRARDRGNTHAGGLPGRREHA